MMFLNLNHIVLRQYRNEMLHIIKYKNKALAKTGL